MYHSVWYVERRLSIVLRFHSGSHHILYAPEFRAREPLALVNLWKCYGDLNIGRRRGGGRRGGHAVEV